MNDSRVRRLLSSVDYRALSDGRHSSGRLKPELPPGGDKLIPPREIPVSPTYDKRRSDRWDNIDVGAPVL